MIIPMNFSDNKDIRSWNSGFFYCTSDFLFISADKNTNR